MKTLLTTAAMIAIASPAFAVDRISSKSNSKSASVAVAGAAAGAVSTSAGGAGGDGGAGGAASIVINGGGGGGLFGLQGAAGAGAPSTTTVTYDFKNQVPDVYAPALAGGGACTESASAGTSNAGFGLSFGLSWEGVNCAVRNEVMVLHNTQQVEEAKVHGCLHLERVKATFELMGKDCLGNPLVKP